ncbi:hypothetical protein BZA77DRAFT_359526 [Pyronema omphalodes]|nr:hypothetical protein BZA77DRAFT_359526 [Pyronema omphalodes]
MPKGSKDIVQWLNNVPDLQPPDGEEPTSPQTDNEDDGVNNITMPQEDRDVPFWLRSAGASVPGAPRGTIYWHGLLSVSDPALPYDPESLQPRTPTVGGSTTTPGSSGTTGNSSGSNDSEPTSGSPDAEKSTEESASGSGSGGNDISSGDAGPTSGPDNADMDVGDSASVSASTGSGPGGDDSAPEASGSNPPGLPDDNAAGNDPHYSSDEPPYEGNGSSPHYILVSGTSIIPDGGISPLTLNGSTTANYEESRPRYSMS